MRGLKEASRPCTLAELDRRERNIHGRYGMEQFQKGDYDAAFERFEARQSPFFLRAILPMFPTLRG